MAVMHFEDRRGDLELSTDPRRLDVAAIHDFLTSSYWAAGIPPRTVELALRNSLCFGLYQLPGDGRGSLPAGESARQVGFARVITDGATFAYLCDVYVLPDWRGRGLARWLVAFVMRHPDLAEVRRFSLVTRDAQDLYRPFGFHELETPSRHMEILRQDVYRR
jgi:ribosomal protein S18 acetylase RimI-like enzyme